ncbi:MAG: hypothetical protein BWY54_01036 [Candidatus Dependentiae bacterium ADurb.Bin331]|nr:MAG: hypothetical protein BWY54_01036 [Candidatus Dependentiae bacterium ADurb.Bin331]
MVRAKRNTSIMLSPITFSASSSSVGLLFSYTNDIFSSVDLIANISPSRLSCKNNADSWSILTPNCSACFLINATTSFSLSGSNKNTYFFSSREENNLLRLSILLKTTIKTEKSDGSLIYSTNSFASLALIFSASCSSTSFCSAKKGTVLSVLITLSSLSSPAR